MGVVKRKAYCYQCMEYMDYTIERRNSYIINKDKKVVHFKEKHGICVRCKLRIGVPELDKYNKNMTNKLLEG